MSSRLVVGFTTTRCTTENEYSIFTQADRSVTVNFLSIPADRSNFNNNNNNNNTTTEFRQTSLGIMPMNLSCVFITAMSILFFQLPIINNRPITLVLDIDETLVHSSSVNRNESFDKCLNLDVANKRLNIYVKYRPLLFQFLNFVSRWFKVIIFTVSHSSYSNALMNRLDPEGKLGSLRLFREHCTKYNGSFVNDLSILGGPLDRVALIDNTHAAYFFQPRNGIPIESWFDNPNDEALLSLIPMLVELSVADNVYRVLEEYNMGLLL